MPTEIAFRWVRILKPISLSSFCSLLLFLLYFIEAGLPQHAHAAVSTEVLLGAKVEEYERNLESKVQKFLGARFSSDAFLIQVQVEINNDALQKAAQSRANSDGTFELLSLPRDVSAAERMRSLVQSLNTQTFRAFVSQVQADLTFDERIDAQLVRTLRPAVTSLLGLDANSGDQLTVKTAKLASRDFQKVIQDLEKENLEQREQTRLLNEAKSALQVQQKQLEQKELILASALERERNEKQRLTERHRELENEVAELREQISIYNTPMGDIKKIVKGLELPLTLFPLTVVVALVVLVVMMMLTATKRLQTRQLMASFEQVAGALGKIGKGSNPLADLQSALQLPSSEPGASRASPAISRDSKTLREQERFIEEAHRAHKELSKHAFARNLILKSWLAEGQVGRLAAYCDFLPIEESDQILELFSASEKSEIADLMASGQHSESGDQVALSLFHETRRYLKERPSWIHDYELPPLLALSSKQVAGILRSCSKDARSLYLLLMPPGLAVASILELPSEAAAEAMHLVPKIPDWPRELRQKVWQELEKAFVNEARTSELVAAPLLIKVLQEGDSTLRTGVVQLLNREPALYAAVRSEVILTEDFLLLDREALAELFDELTVEQLAQLFLVIPDELRQRLASLQSQRNLNQLESEYRNLNSSMSRQRRARVEGERLERLLRQKMARMISSGAIPHPSQVKDGQALAEESQESEVG